MEKIKELGFLFKILFLKPAFAVTIIFYLISILIFSSFNLAKSSLHGIFWKKIRDIYPYGYLIPNGNMISFEKADKQIKKLKKNGINCNALFASPAIIEIDGQVQGVMVNSYYDLSSKLRAKISVQKENNIWIGKDIFNGISKEKKAVLYFRDKNAELKIGGKLNTGFYDIDSYYIYMSLKKYAEITGDNFISEIEINDAESFKKIKQNKPQGFLIESFWDRNPELSKAYKLEKLLFKLINAFFIMVFILALINIYRWQIENIRRSLEILILMGIKKSEFFFLLVFQSLLGFHLGLFLSALIINIFSVFIPFISIPEEVYGIKGISISLLKCFDIKSYMYLIVALIIVNIILYYKFTNDDIIDKIR